MLEQRPLEVPVVQKFILPDQRTNEERELHPSNSE